MVDMSQVLDLYGVAAIRDWIKANFVSKSDADGMMASKVKITFDAAFEGQSYTITGGANESYTGTVPASLIAEQTIKTLNATYTVTCATEDGFPYDREIAVGNFYGIYQGEIHSFRAFIACTTYAGATITAVCDGRTYTGVADSEGAFTFTVRATGTYSLTAKLDGKITPTVTVDVTTAEETYACNLPSQLLTVIVPWATGTDEEIAAMVAALDAGTLSIENTGWAVGDKRTVQLSAMEDTGVGEAHAAQTVELVLSHAGATHGIARADGKPIHFQVDQVHSLKETGYMNRPYADPSSWDGCLRRAWCNEGYYAAIPETLRPIFKKMKVTTAEKYDGSTLKESEDFFALRAEKEVFGSASYSNAKEAAALAQVEWYKTAANRKKNVNGSVDSWWERSPYAIISTNFCLVYSDGAENRAGASNTYGLAPFGCI